MAYYAVIFTSRASGVDAEGYAAAAARMAELARELPGFIGIDSARGDDGLGITVSYWESEEAIAAWKAHAEHVPVQRLGRERWYDWFHTRVARVERESSSR